MDKYLWLANQTAFNAEETDESVRIIGYGCHYNKVNLNKEIVDRNSFNAFFGMYEKGEIDVKCNWEHDRDMIIGGVNSIESDDTGLIIDVTLTKGVKIVDEMIVPNIRAGVIKSYSTEGWILNGYDGIEERENGTYYVKDFLLTNIAIVSHPADPHAEFTVANMLRLAPKEEVAKRLPFWAL